MMGLVVVIVASLGSAAVVAERVPEVGREVIAGMFGPLLAVAISWTLVQRAARVNPAGVRSIMLGGFIVKLLLFGVYVITVTQLPGFRAEPFAVSFAIYFVALYATEAVMLKRLFAGATR
jgi:hypothetical protein